MSDELDDTLVSRYLLGTVDAQERVAIEEKLLFDAEFYQQLLIVEDELIDQYVSNELSARDRNHFEENFAITNERWQKIRFARGLTRYLTKAPHSKGQDAQPSFFTFLNIKNPVGRYALAAVLLIAVGSGIWLIKRSLDNDRRGQGSLAVTLSPGLSRGDGQTSDILLPQDVGELQLRLSVPPVNYERYEAEVVREGRIVIVKNDLIRGESGVLIMTLNPPDLLSGDYQIKLSGIRSNQTKEKLQSYHFRLRR